MDKRPFLSLFLQIARVFADDTLDNSTFFERIDYTVVPYFGDENSSSVTWDELDVENETEPEQGNWIVSWQGSNKTRRYFRTVPDWLKTFLWRSNKYSTRSLSSLYFGCRHELTPTRNLRGTENGSSMVDVLVCKSKKVDKAAKNETVRFESFSDLIEYLNVEPADDNVFSLSSEIWRDIKASYKSSSSFIGNMTEEDSVNGVVDGVESLLGDVTSLFRYEEKTNKNVNNSRKIKDPDKKKNKDSKKKNDFFSHRLNFFGQKKRKDKDIKKMKDRKKDKQRKKEKKNCLMKDMKKNTPYEKHLNTVRDTKKNQMRKRRNPR